MKGKFMTFDKRNLEGEAHGKHYMTIFIFKY